MTKCWFLNFLEKIDVFSFFDRMHSYKTRWDTIMWSFWKTRSFCTPHVLRARLKTQDVYDISKMTIFRGVTSKIEFGENWLYGYGLYYGFGSKQVTHDFPPLLKINIGHTDRFIKNATTKIIFRKKCYFLNRKLGTKWA